MLAAEWLKETIGPSFNLYLLGVIASILAVGVMASLVSERRRAASLALAVGAGDARGRSLTASAVS
jgi:hypothetical protein